MNRRKIVILGTGGTIAGRSASGHDNVGYVAGQVPVEALLQGVATPPEFDLESEQVAQVDSKDMGFEVWRLLANRCGALLADDEVHGLVITHGTDTIEETAFFLQAVLQPAKPVVLTGAMRPASSMSADGPQNLRDAIAVSAAPGARGVVVVFAGAIHSARDVRKVHTYRIDPFASGDAGTTGYVEEGAVRLVKPWPAAKVVAKGASPENLPESAAWPRVEIVMNHAGSSGGVVDALLAQGIDGIVVAGTGNGTLSEKLESALLRAQSAGVRIMRASRCADGRILPQSSDTFARSEGLSPVKARIHLILDLLA